MYRLRSVAFVTLRDAWELARVWIALVNVGLEVACMLEAMIDTVLWPGF